MKNNIKIQELYNSYVDNATSGVYAFRTNDLLVWTTDLSLYYDLLKQETNKAIALYENTGIVSEVNEMIVKLSRNEFVQNKETIEEKWNNAVLCLQEPFIGNGKILGGEQTLILSTKKQSIAECVNCLIFDHAADVGADLNKQYEEVDIPYLMFNIIHDNESVDLENQGIIETAAQLVAASKTLVINTENNDDSQELK